ncbi:hypothetical protein, partial [Thermoleptolyngbya sp.]
EKRKKKKEKRKKETSFFSLRSSFFVLLSSPDVPDLEYSGSSKCPVFRKAGSGIFLVCRISPCDREPFEKALLDY